MYVPEIRATPSTTAIAVRTVRSFRAAIPLREMASIYATAFISSTTSSAAPAGGSRTTLPSTKTTVWSPTAPAGAEDHEVVRDRRGVRVVGDQHDRLAVIVGGAAEHGEHLVAGLGVQ